MISCIHTSHSLVLYSSHMKFIHILIVLLISIWGTYGTYTYLSTQRVWSTDTVNTKNIEIDSPTNNSGRTSLGGMSLSDVEDDLTMVIDQVKPSVVNITASKNIEFIYNRRNPEVVSQTLQLGGGSGILIAESWYILTNKHVVEDPDAEYEVQFSDGSSTISQQARLDPKLDIAVLKVDPSVIWSRETARFQDFSEDLRVWQFAIAIWNALAEFGHSVTLWVISAMNRTISLDGSSIYAGLIQTDTAISQGNSWWPLFDSDWNVIWINTAVSSIWENIWFALPVTQQFVQSTLNSIITNNAIIRPFVWIRYLDLDSSTATSLWISTNTWVYVSEVVQWSAADEVWLQAEDIITSIQWVDISVNKPFMYHLYTYTPWDIVNIQYIRAGITYNTQIEFGGQ